MAEAAVPVDLFNPGQVFACLGLVEAAEILLGDAEGGFDWSGPAAFRLRAAGGGNPVAEVLRFLAEAEMIPWAPEGLDGPWPEEAERSEVFPARTADLRKSDGKGFTGNALPAKLRVGYQEIALQHWIDGSGLETFKLFAGNQVGWEIARLLLSFEQPNAPRKGIRQLWRDESVNLTTDPFGAASGESPLIVPIGEKKFGFDARGAWDAVRLGASLDAQGIPVRVSPVAEVLAAVGLSHARPLSGKGPEVFYAVWNISLPAALCRPVLARPELVLPPNVYRRYRTHTGDDKYYKKFFFAEME